LHFCPIIAHGTVIIKTSYYGTARFLTFSLRRSSHAPQAIGMPPKTKLATTSEGVVGEGSDAPKLKTEDLVEALLDPRVLEALMKALTPFKTSIETTLDKKLESFGATLRYIKAENGVLADKCKALSAENVELKKQIEACSQRVEECERYSRSDNLIFRGLPERSSAEVASAAPSLQDGSTLRESHTSVEETVSAFIKDTLHVDVLPSDISTAHRIKGGAKDTVRPIIVRFASRRVRNLVFGAKKLLKEAPSRVYISEHLTKTDSELFFEARRLLREKKIFAAWTQNGLVHVRHSQDPAARATIVRNRADLAVRP